MDEREREEIIKIAPVIIWGMPVLMVRLMVSYMRIKRKSRRAVRSFKMSIRQEGLPPEVAKMLWKEYDETTSIFRRLASSMMNGFASVPK
jgi:hypothetical protein